MATEYGEGEENNGRNIPIGMLSEKQLRHQYCQ